MYEETPQGTSAAVPALLPGQGKWHLAGDQESNTQSEPRRHFDDIYGGDDDPGGADSHAHVRHSSHPPGHAGDGTCSRLHVTGDAALPAPRADAANDGFDAAAPSPRRRLHQQGLLAPWTVGSPMSVVLNRFLN